MWPLSATAYQTLADGNCTITSRVGIYSAAVGHIADIYDASDWKVDYDAGSDVYAKATAVFSDPSLWSGQLTDPLSPFYGGEMTIDRGLVLVDDFGGTWTEWIPMGRFVITDITDSLPQLGAGGIQVTLADRSTYLADNPIPAGTKSDPTEAVEVAIGRWVRECTPLAGVDYVDQTPTYTLCPKVDLDTNRLTNIHKFAKSIGAEFFFDRAGRAILRPIPLAATAPVVWEVRDGEGGNLVSAKRTVTRTRSLSKVVCMQVIKETGDTAPTPASATSVDTDPTSPTYHPRFGRSGTFRSPLWTTNALCQTNADQIRALSCEAGYTIEASHLPVEALDRGDAVRVRISDGTRLVQAALAFSVGGRASSGPQTLGARGVQLPSEDDDSLAAAAATQASS